MRVSGLPRCVLLVLSLLGLAPCSYAQAAGAFPGGLDPGPHAVGFRIIRIVDASRIAASKADAEARGTPADRARKLAVHVWYPASGAAGAAMTIRDYIDAAELTPGAAPGPFAAEHKSAMPRTLGIALTDAEWKAYSDTALAARRDAPAAAGRFPLLVGMLRPVSVAAMAEYLASHGYAVAFVQRQPREHIAAEGAVLEALQMAEHVRDMEVAIGALRAEPFVDPARLGALGFSGDGLAQLVLAMRHPDVDAVSQLETGYFAPIGTSSYEKVTAYDPAALRTPFFFAYSENLGRNTDMQMAELEKIRYAPRYTIYLGEPRMTHLDFASEGIITATLLDKRRDARSGIVRAYQAAHRHQLAFFDAFVKRDAAARTRLQDGPAATGTGPMIEARVRPAIVPAIGRGEFRGLLDRDPARAFAGAREGLARDPGAAVYEEAWLNGPGYEMLQRALPEKAIEVFKLNVEAHPSSANAHDSLSEALEGAGQRAAAAEWAEKGLAVLPRDASVPPEQRKALEEGLRARLARLKAARLP